MSFNGDSKADLALAGYYDNSVGVRLGNGDGTFGPDVYYGTGSSATCAVAVGYLDADDQPELVASNCDGDSVCVLLGNADGSFSSAVCFATGNGPSSVAVADFNGDTKLDLAVAAEDASSVSVLLNNCN